MRRRTSGWVRRSPWSPTLQEGPHHLAAQRDPHRMLCACAQESASTRSPPGGITAPLEHARMIPAKPSPGGPRRKLPAAAQAGGWSLGTCPRGHAPLFLGSGFHDGRSSCGFYGSRGQDLPADCGDGAPVPLEGTVPGLPVGLMNDLKTQLLRGE